MEQKLKKLSKEVSDLGRDMCLVVTDYDIAKNKCPFLREDCKCNIYNVRPQICRIFGVTPNVRYLNCEFLSGIPNKIPQSEVEASLAEVIKYFNIKI